jgi:hypothetical protein
MRGLHWLRSRLRGRADSEHAQVFVRIAITALFSAYLGWEVSDGNRNPALFATWLILIVVVISAGNAVVRYAIDWSSNALLEIQWYLFSAVFLLAAGYVLKRNEHIRIDIIAGRLSARAQNWMSSATWSSSCRSRASRCTCRGRCSCWRGTPARCRPTRVAWCAGRCDC